MDRLGEMEVLVAIVDGCGFRQSPSWQAANAPRAYADRAA